MDDASQSLLTERHLRYINIALKMCAKSVGQHKHGCVIVSGGRIVAKGRNDYRNGRHAECNAIGKNWKSEYKDAIIYIARARKEQPFGLSKPCPECERAIKDCGIRMAVYSTNDVDSPLAVDYY